jgi:hypothetical protein
MLYKFEVFFFKSHICGILSTEIFVKVAEENRNFAKQAKKESDDLRRVFLSSLTWYSSLGGLESQPQYLNVICGVIRRVDT